MTASQQPTGHDKAVEIVSEIVYNDWQNEAHAAEKILAALRAALAAGDAKVAEALGGRIDERFSPRFVDDGPCNGRCQTVACDDSHRGHRLEWRNLRRFVTDWTDAP